MTPREGPMPTSISFAPIGDPIDPAEQLRGAISSYQEALRVYTLETDPRNFAYAQLNLGIALSSYAQFISTERVAILLRAVECYQEALKVYKLEDSPQEYASTQMNLGLTYTQLATPPVPVPY